MTDCDDLLQNVFLAAMKNLDQFERRSGLPTWLTRIAINAVRAERRRRLLRARHWLALAHEPMRPIEPPDPGLDIDERQQQVTHAVAGLPAKYREVIVLRYLQDLTLDETAEVLKLRKNAVEVRLHRARQMLADTLKLT